MDRIHNLRLSKTPLRLGPEDSRRAVNRRLNTKANAETSVPTSPAVSGDHVQKLYCCDSELKLQLRETKYKYTTETVKIEIHAGLRTSLCGHTKMIGLYETP